MKLHFLVIFAFLAACGHVDYAKVERGDFKGSLFVMWVGEGGRSGDGKFVYVPNPRDPLRFSGPSTGGREIRPEMMYTDGGSIPRIGQFFNGFSPWGYAPAYMVHDWVFVARHCNLDGTPTRREAEISEMTFHQSAVLIAEAIKTLADSGRVRRNDVAGHVISSAVDGPISRRLWNKRGACEAARVSEADRIAAEAAIPGSSQARLRSARRVLPDGTTEPVRPATVIGLFAF